MPNIYKLKFFRVYIFLVYLFYILSIPLFYYITEHLFSMKNVKVFPIKQHKKPYIFPSKSFIFYENIITPAINAPLVIKNIPDIAILFFS